MKQLSVRSRRASMLTVLALGTSLFLVSGCTPAATFAQPVVTIGQISINPKDEQAIEQGLAQLAVRYEKPAISASKDYNTNTIIGDTPGKVLDIEATKNRIHEAQPGSQIEPVLKSVPAAVTIRHLATDTPDGFTKIGKFSTRLPREKGSLVNIQISSDLLTDSVVMPGENLSLNKVTGYPTPDRGFQPGSGIDNGKIVQIYGGGISQVATTLYQAALKADLEIVERHPHSMPVSYVPPGEDATTFIEEGKDFIFKNTRSTPVIVKSKLHDGVLTVTIFGK